MEMDNRNLELLIELLSPYETVLCFIKEWILKQSGGCKVDYAFTEIPSECHSCGLYLLIMEVSSIHPLGKKLLECEKLRKMSSLFGA